MRRLLLVLFALLPLLGCNDARPPKTQALAQIKNYLVVDGIFDIADMQYVNGYQKDISTYVVAAKYKVVFLKSTTDIENTLKNNSRNTSLAEGLANIAVGAGLLFKYGEVKAGDAFDESGEYVFLKTEKGWILQDKQ